MLNAMLISKVSEAQLGCLDLIDFSPKVIQVFIEILYCDNVLYKSWRSIAQELWQLVDKYDVRHIKYSIESCSTLIGVNDTHDFKEWAELFDRMYWGIDGWNSL